MPKGRTAYILGLLIFGVGLSLVPVSCVVVDWSYQKGTLAIAATLVLLGITLMQST